MTQSDHEYLESEDDTKELKKDLDETIFTDDFDCNDICFSPPDNNPVTQGWN